MNWTDERVELLKKLWAEGLSASQVASQLGGVSRNAVIGKVHRLKLAGRGRSSSASPRPKKVSNGGQGKPPRASRQVSTSLGNTALKARFEADPQFEEERKPLESIVIPIPLKLKLVELSERTCKWPIGDPLSEDFAFCGNDVGECGPYCTYHSRLAYQPAAERRKSR